VEDIEKENASLSERKVFEEKNQEGRSVRVPAAKNNIFKILLKEKYIKILIPNLFYRKKNGHKKPMSKKNFPKIELEKIIFLVRP
jgi:hypothetical protein